MSRKLNFLHLTTFYPPYSFGGDAMHVYRLSHALGDAGHQVDVIHCVDSYHLLHARDPEISFASHPNVHTHQLSSHKWLSPLLTQQTGRAYFKHRQIQEVMNRKRYDVIHYHNTSLLGPEILTFESPGSDAIKLYTTHEHWLICPTHVLWKFGNRPCEKPECFRCTIQAKRPPQLWRYTNYLEKTVTHVDQFVSPSRFTAKMHAERGFPIPVAHLPYFIDPADSDWRRPRERPHPRPYFLFVGRLEKIKGLHTLIEQWQNVNDYDLLVAGAGVEEEFLRRQAANNPRIRFLGPQPQHNLGNLYYHAIACIVPSLTYETFGIIIIEAFARKTPVIVRELGALPEVVRESGGGFVYDSDDQLVQAIHSLGRSEELRNELGSKGYDAFLNKWSRDAHLKMYFGFLLKTAKKKFGFVPWENEPAEAPELKQIVAV